MSNEKICTRCGHELTAADFAEGFCLVCGEPAAPPEEFQAEAPVQEENAPAGPARLEWQLDGEYVLCPSCGASYYADEAPAQCERCAAAPQYEKTVWEMPSAGAPLLLVHRGSGQEIALADGLELGRLHTSCLQDDRYVSRHHATILVQDGSVLVRDEDSGNGTRVNGTRLQPRKAHPLRAGDVLALDEQCFEVRRADKR